MYDGFSELPGFTDIKQDGLYVGTEDPYFGVITVSCRSPDCFDCSERASSFLDSFCLPAIHSSCKTAVSKITQQDVVFSDTQDYFLLLFLQHDHPENFSSDKRELQQADVQRNEIPPTIFGVLSYRRRSQWPSGLRRGSATDRFLALRVRTPPPSRGPRMFVLYVVR